MAMIAASTHPFANWRAQKKVDKERYSVLARDMQALAVAPGDLRHARPRRHRGRGAADRPDEPGDLLPAAPAGAVDLVAVLGGPADRPQGVPADRLRRSAAQRPAGVLRQRRRMAPHAAPARADRPVRRRHQDLVGHPAERPLPDARAARLRHLHPARRRRSPSPRCGSRSSPRSIACAPATRPGAATGARWSRRTSGSPSATASAPSSPTSACSRASPSACWWRS